MHTPMARQPSQNSRSSLDSSGIHHPSRKPQSSFETLPLRRNRRREDGMSDESALAKVNARRAMSGQPPINGSHSSFSARRTPSSLKPQKNNVIESRAPSFSSSLPDTPSAKSANTKDGSQIRQQPPHSNNFSSSSKAPINQHAQASSPSRNSPLSAPPKASPKNPDRQSNVNPQPIREKLPEWATDKIKKKKKRHSRKTPGSSEH